MNIVVTGASGQLGQELKSIIETGKSEIGVFPQDLSKNKVYYCDSQELDISDEQAVTLYFDQNKVDVVINCAALTNVDGCEQEADLAMKVNSIGARNLAIACETQGAKLIHVSTDYVFDGTAQTPYVEWDSCNPQGIYGKSKLLGEQYVQTLCSRYFIVRTAWLYGYIGKNFVKTILSLAKEKGQLKVVDDQVGNPTNANDLAYHILKLAYTQSYGVYHITGNGSCSWYAFTKEILNKANVPCVLSPCTTDQFPRPAKRPAYSALDHAMLRATIGDEMRDWKTAIATYIENLT